MGQTAQQKKGRVRRRPALRRRFDWTTQRKRALALLWDSEMGHDAIARACGVSGRQLSRWKAHPAFQAAQQAQADASWGEYFATLRDSSARVVCAHDSPGYRFDTETRRFRPASITEPESVSNR